MDFLPPVVAVLLADTKGLKAGMAEANTEVTGFGANVERAGAMSRTAFLGVGLAAAGISIAAVDMASNFNAAMERVHTQAGATQSEVDALRGSVLALAGTTGQAPEQLALSLYHLESAGFRGKEALALVEAAAKGATIGNANLESVTQAMIATVASGIPGVHGAADAMALLNTTVGIGDMKMQGLADAMATGILPAARVAGLSFTDVAAALATITDNATPANVTATRLRMSISMMAAPTGAAVKALKSIGMTQYEMADLMRKPGGLLLALQDLHGHLDKLKNPDKAMNAITRAFGGGRTAGSIETLLVEMDRLKTKYKELGTHATRAKTFQEAWAATQDQFKTKVSMLWGSVQSLLIQWGSFLIPIITQVAGKFADAITWITKNKTAMVVLGAVIGTVLVAGLVAAVGALAAFAFALVTDPVFLVVAAIAALAAGLYWAFQNVGWFHDAVVNAWKWLSGTALPAIVNFGKGVWHWLGAVWHSISDAVRHGVAAVSGWVMSWLGPFIGWWKGHWSEIQRAVQVAWALITNGVRVAWAILGPIISNGITVLSAIWTFTWGVIVDTVKFVWNLIVGIVKIAWDTLSGTVRIAFQAVRTIIEVGLAILSGHWSDAWNALVDGFKRIFSTIWDVAKTIIGTLWDTIKTAVGDFGTLLWDAGKNLIQGLIDGVKSMISAVTGAIGNVGSTVLDTVKSVFGINSPSREFHNIGLGLGEGLVNGINASVPRVRMTAAQMAAAAARGARADAHDAGHHAVAHHATHHRRNHSGTVVGGRSHYSGGGSSSSGGEVWDVHVYLDGKELRSAVVTETKRYKTRNGRTNLT